MIKVLSRVRLSSASLTGAPFNAALTRCTSSARLRAEGFVSTAGHSCAAKALPAALASAPSAAIAWRVAREIIAA
jgi:hypothetical protein